MLGMGDEVRSLWAFPPEDNRRGDTPSKDSADAPSALSRSGREKAFEKTAAMPQQERALREVKSEI